MSNKKKLQKIMAEDDQMFQAMSSKQFGRGPIALRTVEQPKKSPPKKRVRKAVRGVSQFTVSPFGVFDALSSSLTASMFPVPQASDKVDASKDVDESEADDSPVQAVPPQANRGEEAPAPTGNNNQLSQDSRDTGSASVEAPEAEDEPQDFDLDPQPSQDVPSLFEPIDASRESDIPDVEVPSLTEVTSGNEPVDFNTPESREIELIVNHDFGIEDDQDPPTLVEKRRERAQNESDAAARNFARRQAPPIAGIPDPVPIQPIRFEGEAEGPNGDEALMAKDRATTQQLEFSQAMVDITEKMALEMQALSIRLRNVELLLDRL